MDLVILAGLGLRRNTSRLVEWALRIFVPMAATAATCTVRLQLSLGELLIELLARELLTLLAVLEAFRIDPLALMTSL